MCVYVTPDEDERRLADGEQRRRTAADQRDSKSSDQKTFPPPNFYTAGQSHDMDL